MEPLKIAYSSCPNDTYLFFAWQKGIVGKQLPIDPSLYDIQKLNELLKEENFDILKCSAIAAMRNLDRYTILPVGAAMGFGMGPLVVGKRDFEPSEFANLRVAIPGADTVAAHLTHGLLPAFKEVVYCRYDQVLDLIENDEVECGVIIHETRFTYVEKGFQLVADLGEIWERKIDAPLPLGVLVARRDLGEELIDQATHILRASLRYAYERSEQAMEYVLKHSIEKDLDVVYDHIQTYVNEETMSMSDEGSKALQTLNELMQKSEETLSIRH